MSLIEKMGIFDKLFGKKKVVERRERKEKLEEVGAHDAPEERQIELHGDWKSDLMGELTYVGKRKRDSVKVYADPNLVKKFLSQKALPYIWSDDEHRNYINSKGDAQEYLLWLWIIVYLHHPNPEVIIETLRFSQEIKKKEYSYFDIVPD